MRKATMGVRLCIPASWRVASVAVISGTGIKEMNAANASQYFTEASGLPDFMIYKLSRLSRGTDWIKMAGFFDNNWGTIR